MEYETFSRSEVADVLRARVEQLKDAKEQRLQALGATDLVVQRIDGAVMDHEHLIFLLMTGGPLPGDEERGLGPDDMLLKPGPDGELTPVYGKPTPVLVTPGPNGSLHIKAANSHALEELAQEMPIAAPTDE